MGLLDPMPQRLTKDLEPILALPDPRPKISSYHTMPYAIFRYDPTEEFALRAQVGMLRTRLEQRGKRVSVISLAECLDVAMREVRPLEDWFEAERSVGTEIVIDTVHEILSNEQRLERLVIERMPVNPDPTRDVVFITRTGALFPVYRTFTLLEQLHGQVYVPTVLFYPGDLESPAGLKFMGVLQAEHNYRSRIF
jgi:BREX protein BrxB